MGKRHSTHHDRGKGILSVQTRLKLQACSYPYPLLCYETIGHACLRTGCSRAHALIVVRCIALLCRVRNLATTIGSAQTGLAATRSVQEPAGFGCTAFTVWARGDPWQDPLLCSTPYPLLSRCCKVCFERSTMPPQQWTFRPLSNQHGR